MATKNQRTTSVIEKDDLAPFIGQERSASLVMIYGSEPGKRFDLEDQPVVIGRADDCDIPIDQTAISRQHAQISREDKYFYVEDLGSKNGTHVGQKKVKRQRLRNGDLIRVGHTIFKFLYTSNVERAYYDTMYLLTVSDGLTQTYNGRYFTETLEREVARALRYERTLSLILFDVDQFKEINDRYGHLAGDFALSQVAAIARERLRRTDILARYGGDEFAILLPEIDEAAAYQLAEHIRSLVESAPFRGRESDITITISAGVASLDLVAHEVANALFKRADERLYQAKNGGRNRVVGAA